MHAPTHNPSLAAARPPLPRLLQAWAAVLLLTLGWDVSGADLAVMQAIGHPDGFAWRHQWLLEVVLHDGLRRVALGLFALLGLWALWPTRPEVGLRQRVARRERVAVVLLVLLSLLAVNLVKSSSRTSCPWELQLFGGHASYVSHWNLWAGDGGGGRCFPGGHASSAFAFLALCLPWLAPPHAAARPARHGWGVLGAVLLVGLVAGATQTLRGAHHPSHTLWTLLICGGVSLAGWYAARPWVAAGRREGCSVSQAAGPSP